MKKIKLKEVKEEDFIKLTNPSNKEDWKISYAKISKIEKVKTIALGLYHYWADCWCDFDDKGNFLKVTGDLFISNADAKMREAEIYLLTESEFNDLVGKYFIINGLSNWKW
jgi:hypothetical protein